MDSTSPPQHLLRHNRSELITLAFGAGVLALLNFSGMLPFLLEGKAAWIVAGLVLLGGVVVLL